MDQNKDFNKEANSWDQVPGRIKLADDVARAIQNAGILDKNMNALDFGCGTGLLTLAIQPHVHAITGADNSTGMLEVFQEKVNSRQLANVKTEYVNLEQGDSLNGTYDMIVSSMTMHHIKDLESLFKQFYNVCKSNGMLCIADLDPDNGLFHADNQGVFHFGFERDHMQQLFSEAGFKVIQILTAAEVTRPAPDQLRTFTIFLMIGQKTE